MLERDEKSQSAPLSWEVHRARETPVKTTVAALSLAGLLTLAVWYFGWLLALVALLVLAVALHSYFLPITYRFDSNGVTVDKRIFRYSYPWSQFRRYFRTGGGLVLSPFSQRTFLDNFRGVHLLLPRDPDAIFDYLGKRVPERQSDAP